MEYDNMHDDFICENMLDCVDDAYYDTYDDIVLPSNFEDIDIDNITKNMNKILSSLTDKECSSEEIKKIKRDYISIYEENKSIIEKTPLLKDMIKMIDKHFCNKNNIITNNYENELKNYQQLLREYDLRMYINRQTLTKNNDVINKFELELFECQENLKRYSDNMSNNFESELFDL